MDIVPVAYVSTNSPDIFLRQFCAQIWSLFSLIKSVLYDQDCIRMIEKSEIINKCQRQVQGLGCSYPGFEASDSQREWEKEWASF